MRSRNFGRYALCNCLAAAMLAGCGGSQQSMATLPAGSSAVRQANQHRNSAGSDLIYAAADGKAYVVSYPQGKLVSTINEGGGDICSNGSGNVYLVVDNRVDEFAHGSTTPSASFNVPSSSVGCAVDPSTGNLAVTFELASGNNVAIFSSGSSNPVLFKADLDASTCGYDNQGNLFVTGYEDGNVEGVAELPENSSTFESISVAPSIQGEYGRVQWDGSYLTIEAYDTGKRGPHTVTVNRLSISGSGATVVGTTSIKGIKKSAFLSWLEDNRVVIPFGNASRATPNIGYWKYPSGGRPVRTLKAPAGHAVIFNAVTVSVGS